MARKTIAFHRRYYGYTGGHQKVRDYLDHFIALGWSPTLFLDNRAATNTDLFDDINGVRYQPEFSPQPEDTVFLAGEDWEAYLNFTGNEVNHTVFNLIQHVRHAEAGSRLRSYLALPAVRVCVSEAVREAILPFANGPCLTVKMGHNLPDISLPKQRDVYILASKQPALGIALTEKLKDKGLTTLLHTGVVEHTEVINAMASSTLTVPLPHKTEGFYLPGIEAMWLSDIAVIPDCVANREYLRGVVNGFICKPELDAILTQVLHGLALSAGEKFLRRTLGRRMVKRYSKEREKKQLAKILKNHFSAT